ncbi:uncharacterized protein si:ch211-214j24.10 [Lampris incognitus]|uniref:uncharacterized protein si:ch211-214j24.10 n=1 Tax=Lampris incognitus TaxID=2546036 RepID=UPI0024B571F8|nr:uncharacterized protein si:ch211-214j24.10 [Lampris incognitus]
MHIKTGSWEASNTVCESDTLCDPAVLVSATNSEPHIRNRRLSPGSGNCSGGGGGCIAGVDQTPRQQLSPGAPESSLNGPHTHAFAFRREKERRGQHKGRGLRREAPKAAGRANDRAQKLNQKERWVEDSLSLLKPPPAFPVQDSPAKLQPAVSYASKVKAGAASGTLEEDRPAIGVLLQNQWGLSFISEARPAAALDGPGSLPAGPAAPPLPTEPKEPSEQPTETGCTGNMQGADSAVPATATRTLGPCPDADETNGELLLSCRHLVEAWNYHNREWNAVLNKLKDPKRVVWFKDTLEQPA